MLVHWLLPLCFVLPASAQILLRPHPLDVSNLSIPDPTKTYLRSSFDPFDGNQDSGNLIRIEPANAKFTDPRSEWILFESQGPGVLTSVWLTGRNRQGQPFLGGQLNFYFDGESVPSFSGELPTLFESNLTLPKPLAEKSSGAWISYGTIYYAKSLKISISNHEDSYAHRKNTRGEESPHLYYQFSYQRLPLPVRTTRLGVDKLPVWRRIPDGERDEHTIDMADNSLVTVYEAHGRGILNTLRLRWLAGEPDDAILHVTADGHKLITLKVSEFWGFSRRARPQARFRSLLLGVDEDRTYYCHFPMPHRRSLRIQMEQPGPGARLQVEALHHRGWPEKEHYYFHADRVTDTTQPDRDITLLRAAGPGHYVGVILEFSERTMEGDDRFYVDGENYPPAWHGTGTDDYFRCGWGFANGPVSRPLYGLIDAQRPRVAYRFHLADRINFTRSAVLGFEHGQKNDYLGPLHGVVFWYSSN